MDKHSYSPACVAVQPMVKVVVSQQAVQVAKQCSIKSSRKLIEPVRVIPQ